LIRRPIAAMLCAGGRFSQSHGGLGRVDLQDYHAYAHHMVRYYDNPTNDARRTGDAEWARHYRAEFDRADHFGEVARAAQDAVRGKRALEVACGHCRWTPFLAEVAEHVLATDAAPNMLEWGKRIMSHALPGATNVGYLLADAYRPDEIPGGPFAAATVMNFFQHVPTAKQDAFLILLHARLSPGATVFLGANHFSSRFREELFRKPSTDPRDTYSTRHRPDGTTYEIIDNEFDEAAIEMILAPHARDLKYTSGKSWWWVTTQVA
jgi:SAM-dependent methyltransferase